MELNNKTQEFMSWLWGHYKKLRYVGESQLKEIMINYQEKESVLLDERPEFIKELIIEIKEKLKNDKT